MRFRTLSKDWVKNMLLFTLISLINNCICLNNMLLFINVYYFMDLMKSLKILLGSQYYGIFNLEF